MQDNTLQAFATKMIEVMPAVVRGFLHMQTDAVARGKLSVPQFLVLDLLYRKGALNMTELARDSATSLPAMSGLVDRLFKMNLIERHYDRKDRRIIKISLTSKAEEIIKELLQQRKMRIIRIFGQLQESERNEYLRILMKVRNIVSEKLKN